MPNLLQVTPFLQMKDLPAAVRFFVDILGFRALHHDRYYAYLERDSAAVRLALASDEPSERAEYGLSAFLFYLDVADVAALLEEIAPKLAAAGLPSGKGPRDQTWGKREWWVEGPEGGLIVFGQSIEQP